MQLGFIRNGKIIQIMEIAEIPVMPNGLCTPPPPPPPTHTLSLRPQHYGIPLL